MNHKEAKKIFPKKDYELFEAILMNQVGRTSDTDLKHKATLARKLRTKYRDLARREIASVRSRKTNEMDTDINDRRVALFQDLIDRIEELLEYRREKRGEPDTRASAIVAD